MRCEKRKEAWRVVMPPQYKILQNRQLPWKAGVIKWHLANWSKDMDKHKQVSIFKDTFAMFNHELWPLRFESTDNVGEAEMKIYFVDDDDKIRVNGTTKDSPFIFSDSPSTIAVAYPYYPGFEHSMTMFVGDRHFYAYKDQAGSFMLSKVILHEGLHSLGLDHTNAKSDILNPVYDVKNYFTQDSRDGLNHLHGKARTKRLASDPAGQYLIKNFTSPKSNGFIMNQPKWRGVGRHILTMVGTVLVTLGFTKLIQADVTGIVDNLDIIVGAVMNIIGIYTSIKTREKQVSNAQFEAMKAH